MLLGKAPFGGSLAQVMSQHLHKPPPLDQLQDLPACLQALVAHMIEKELTKRPQSPGDLRAEVEACIAELRSVPVAPVEEQEFATIIEGAVPQPLLSSAAKASAAKRAPAKRSWVGMIVLALAIALIGVGLSLFLWSRQTTKPPQVTQALPAPPAIPTVSQVPIPSAPPASPAPSASMPTPAPSLGKPAQLTREMLAEAEQAEAAQEWPKAIMAYVQLHRRFPESDVPRVRLELLLSKLQAESDELKEENVEQLRVPLTEAAKLEVVSAMELLGESLRQRDPKAAFAWLCSAAARGRADAMEEVGLRYSNGAGVERDLAKAAQWFEMARTAGDADAGTLLAECYLFGKGVAKNEGKAISLLRDAVAAKDPRAMDQLANCYHKGIGVTQNDAEAFRLYSQAAGLHYLDSAGNLGVLYLTSEATNLGKNLPARTQAAVKLFRDGAKENNPFCMYLYARCLESGNGLPQDEKAATDWYRRAAEEGNRPAQEWCRQHQVSFEPKPTP